jgi:hypothetical protein
MDDALALALERPRFVQDFESGLSSEAGHAAGKLQFVLRGLSHDGRNS